MKKAFTLIELLIVVAIIAILAAIAVPNFLEAQTRSKVSRVKGDMRSVSMAIESYALDNNGRYPLLRGMIGYAGAPNALDRGALYCAFDLTTPIAYMSTTRIIDPFVKNQSYTAYGFIQNGQVDQAGEAFLTVCYINPPLWWQNNGGGIAKDPQLGNRPKWFLVSLGPDCIRGPDPYPELNGAFWNLASYAGQYDYTWKNPDVNCDLLNYDPTNGTTSGGDIIRHQ